MSKEDFTKFICDNCGKTLVALSNCEFPYGSGWVYVHELNFKVSKDNIIKENELHFCSNLCSVFFIRNTINSSRKKNEKNINNNSCPLFN